jgi:hypothetical protein
MTARMKRNNNKLTRIAQLVTRTGDSLSGGSFCGFDTKRKISARRYGAAYPEKEKHEDISLKKQCDASSHAFAELRL